MEKKKFEKLLKSAKKEYNEEKDERAKQTIKSLLQEYEMAKSTVTRLEKQMKSLVKEGITDESFLLDYDEE